MKRILILSFSFAVMALGNINASTQEDQSLLATAEKSCFEGARETVIVLYGEVNLDNAGLVNDLTEACEDGRLSFN